MDRRTKVNWFILDNPGSRDYYIFAVLSTTLEIRSVKTGSILQILQAKDIESSFFQGDAYLASQSTVWRLLPLDFDDQVDDLLVHNRFDDATALLKELDFTTVAERDANIAKVKGLLAQHLFQVKNEFDDAISILKGLNASPIDVISLFPEYRIDSSTPEHTSDTKALISLTSYLKEVRVQLRDQRKVIRKPSRFNMNSRMSLIEEYRGIEEFKNYTDTVFLSQLVDTTLMRSLVDQDDNVQLLDLMTCDNFCNLSVTITTLTEARNSEALSAFYRQRRLHRNALELIVNRYAKINLAIFLNQNQLR